MVGSACDCWVSPCESCVGDFVLGVLIVHDFFFVSCWGFGRLVVDGEIVVVPGRFGPMVAGAFGDSVRGLL